MTFDEVLRRSLDALTRDLGSAVDAEREDAARRARAEAEESAQRARADAAAAAAAALDQAQAAAEQRGLAAGREEGLVEGRRQGLHQGQQEGFEAGKTEGFQAGRAEGKAEGLTAGRAEGLAEGLAEGREAGRREAGASADAADLATGERVADALRAIDRSRSLSEILDTLAGCAGREATRAAVFLSREGQLRGWRFIGFGPAFDRASSIDVPLADAGLIEEAVQTKAVACRDAAEAGAVPRFAAPAHDSDMLAAPMVVGGEVVAVLYADQHHGAHEGRPPRFAWRTTLEMMTRHAARCLESATALRAAQMVAGAGGALRLAGSGQSDEEQAARRYARLLVSEIKLYHEADVIAGRRERDLGTRLGGEIARARVLYDQRVPAHLRGGDYFQEELVRTLADGDEQNLKPHA